LEPTGKISFWVGSTQIGQTAQPLLQNVWQYIEWQVVLSGTATGSVTIKIDGGPALAMTNLITRTGSVNAWDEIRFGQFTSGGALGVEWSMADMYLSDGTGADGWTGLKGPQRVDATYPNAPGSNSGWTRSTGADQSATVDEVLANGDTDYNSTNVLNAKDSLNFPSFPVSGAVVNGIQHVLQAKKTDAGPVGIKALARIGGVDYLTAQELFIPTTYGFMCYPQGLSPATGIPWTTAEYDAAEFGQQKTT
jgi:hypothetical protein